ncbi:hypothetical protein [Rhizobium oryziradicis]|uniref:Beta-carotene 15,15'-monooxygenase n=1 Tax=Rhizobium oryziradicis TaxID=1867956 RepID=A0A1Q8ZP86_9HYPH|nr:hypothetical protein [Rhizobium oryziradicis]OLP43588.1 hypothetical protein BJF95_22320 [Rhizobium oryziradicis]
MISWTIFKHSLNLIKDNKNAALKITLPFIVVTLLMHTMLIFEASTDFFNAAIFSRFMLFAYLIFAVISYPWIAVAWHRYILIDDYPSLLPRFHGPQIFRYLVTGTAISLLLVICALPFFIFSHLLALTQSLVYAVLIIASLGIVVSSVIMMRLSTILPAAALNERRSFGEIWTVTRGHTKTFVALLIMIFFANAPMKIISIILANAQLPLVSLLWDTFSGFAIVMIGLSVITTQYGYFVENRPLQE